jgi:hypothetical protein
MEPELIAKDLDLLRRFDAETDARPFDADDDDVDVVADPDAFLRPAADD